MLSAAAFDLPVVYSMGTRPWSITTADFNDDGKADLAVANDDVDSVSVLLNNGDGTFRGTVDCASGQEPFVTAADFNGELRRQ